MTPPNHNPVLAESALKIKATEGAETADIAPTDSWRVTWMHLLWNDRRFVAKSVLCGFVLTAVIAFLIPVRYEARTRLMPPEQQAGSGLAMLAALAGKGSGASGGGTGAMGSTLGTMAGDLLGIKSSGALFVDMLDGPTIQDSLIQKFDLRKAYRTRYWQDARKELASHTEVKEDRKSGVLTIVVTDHDPSRAQQMAQAYVEALNKLVAQVSTSSARRERIFLEQRLTNVKESLDAAAQQFSEFASKNGTLDLPTQSKAMVESEARLQGEMVAAQSELEGLQQIYTDNNIRVRSLRARIASLKHDVENMSGNRADLNSSESQIAGDFPSIRKLPLVGVRWANLYRESKIQEAVYEILTQEYEFAKVQEAKEIPTVNVLDPPLLPERKSFPPRILTTVLGTVFAFFLASSVIIGTAAWKQNQSPEKQLASEIWTQIAARDSKPRVVAHQVWSKLHGHNGRKTA